MYKKVLYKQKTTNFLKWKLVCTVTKSIYKSFIIVRQFVQTSLTIKQKKLSTKSKAKSKNKKLTFCVFTQNFTSLSWASWAKFCIWKLWTK